MRRSFLSYLHLFAACSSVLLAGDATAEPTPVRFAVTDLFLVSADSFDAALEICERNPNAQSVGVDWGNANGGRVLQLCLKRERLDVLSSISTSTSSNSNSTHVVQRIAVYKSSQRRSCLPTESELVHPSDEVVVCVRRLPLSPLLLASGNFLSDLWVSTDQHYNSNLPGWNAIETSVLAPADSVWRALWQWMWTPSYSGAFLTYQKPLVPIREVEVVQVAIADATADACMNARGDAWELGGWESLDVEKDKSKKAVLCLRRGDTATSDTVAAALTAISIVDSSDATCDHKGDGSSMITRLPLGASDRSLCLVWQLSPTSHAVLVDLQLANRQETTLRGQFEQVSPLNLNTAGRPTIHLFAQSTWKTFALIDEPADENGLLNKPPLVANVHIDTTSQNASLSYKILQIADLHYSGDRTTRCNDVPLGMKSSDCSEALMTKFVNELLDLEKPDFVAFTGDNVQVYSKGLRQAAINSVVQGVVERGIPFAVIFGNHDDERGFTREAMMKLYLHKPLAYSRSGPLNVDGVGNYELNVLAPVNGAWGVKGSDVFRMYFIDSGAYPDNTKTPHHVSNYDWIKPSQIAYYRQLATGHATTKTTVPAIMFFHIPLPEYAMDAPSLRTVGDHKEDVASSGVNTNLFSSLVELGDVKATFCGHDHVNDYCYKRQGVHLCYGGGIGFGTAYGWSSVPRRARVIEWRVDSQNRRTMTSWRRVFGETDRRQLEEVLYSEDKPMAMPAAVMANAVR